MRERVYRMGQAKIEEKRRGKGRKRREEGEEEVGLLRG